MGYYTTFELEIHEKPEDFDVDKLDLFMMKQKTFANLMIHNLCTRIANKKII